ncbi:hypothetical protein [Stenotrophomonas indicatrix]|uniref:hypothetical protein n=1 Tax=Stenotrophomonas indicatrix TaxID=2045451 RepID=UPI00215A3383|nr:hypothetical protein [Stenotrophomonas indicatrix]MCR8716676.1 hypothetical protein [Stenotrophomonas indicatrix]
MERTQKALTMADVAGWGSAVVTFGLIQGALYLKAYWGHFGLDPFQFVAVSELALAGLAGIGMVLFLMLVALLFGGWMEIKMTSGSAKSKLFAWLFPMLFFTGLGLLLWWSNTWPLLIGLLLTIICALIVQLSPVVPATVKDSPWLIYALVMLVYVSIVSITLGSERAGTISSGGGKHVAAATIDGEVQGGLGLIGRLGDSYALWDPARKAAVLVPVGDVGRLEIVRKGVMPVPAAK